MDSVPDLEGKDVFSEKKGPSWTARILGVLIPIYVVFCTLTLALAGRRVPVFMGSLLPWISHLALVIGLVLAFFVPNYLLKIASQKDFLASDRIALLFLAGVAFVVILFASLAVGFTGPSIYPGPSPFS